MRFSLNLSAILKAVSGFDDALLLLGDGFQQLRGYGALCRSIFRESMPNFLPFLIPLQDFLQVIFGGNKRI